MKKLSFWSIVLLTINSIIGTGIFLSPGAVMGIAGRYTPIVFVLAAMFATVLAVTFASASKYVNKSGAAYAYARAAFGKKVGFYVGITRYIAGCIAWGVLATAVVKTVIVIFGGDNTNKTMVTIGFLVLMATLLLINLAGNKIFAIINNISTIGKLLALVTTIITGIVIIINLDQLHFSDVNQIVDASKIDSSKFVVAIIAAFYAFTGFESVASGAEDMKSPEKSLPRALLLAVMMITVVYLGIVLTIMFINPLALVQTKQVVTLVAVFDSPIIQKIILYGALISMFGINVAASFSTPRVIEAIANQNQISPWFKKRTKQDVPLNAFIVTFIFALVIPMVFQYNMTSIIILSSIARFIQFLVVPVCVIAFYYNKNKETVLSQVTKNLFTDVVLPIFSLLLTIILLVKFNWKAQFSIVENGHSSLNYLAISAMVLGYIVVPLALYLFNQQKQRQQS